MSRSVTPSMQRANDGPRWRSIPTRFLWLYPGLLPAPLFVVLVNGIHDRAAAEVKRFSRLAMAFAMMMAATVLIADYLIQLRVIQPAVLKGELDGLAPLTQYNPHRVFIALEACRSPTGSASSIGLK